MLYVIISEDVDNSLDLRAKARPKHLERLEELKHQGRLFVAGPNPSIDCDQSKNAGFSGSLVIAEFDNLEDAIDWAEKDPYIEAGVYIKTTVKPFKKVLP